MAPPPTEPPAALAGFTVETFAHGGTGRSVYVAGDGPAVVVLAEMPGITPAVVAFAHRVVAAGHTVFLPQLFGRPGEAPSTAAYVRSLVPACVSREFRAFATGATPPVLDWLRALAVEAHDRCGGPGVGAVGMCFTGGFALAMATAPRMVAPVLSQPSLPIGPTGAAKRSVGLSDHDQLAVRSRVTDPDDDLCVLGLRFSGDPLCPPERFASLRHLLGDAFIGVELDSSPGNPWGHRRAAHSVLTEDLDDADGTPTRAALDQVLEFLHRRLHPA